MSNETLTLVSWFKNAQHVNVAPNWIQKNVNEIRRKSQASNLSLNDVRQSLWALWLNSDLNLNPNSCLPQDVTTQEKQILKGNFILQLQEIKDISQSAYSQLTKIPNKDADPDEAQEFEAKWKPKPTRMMWLTLTDGKEIVMGMEYEPIPSITPSILPGCKISIFGSIQCRFGVILLTKNNMKIVGGVVEALKEQNSTVNVLTKLLGNENLTKMMKDNHDNKLLDRGKTAVIGDNDFPDDVIDLDEIDRLEKSALDNRVPQNTKGFNNNENVDEEWEDDDGFNDFLDDVIEIDEIDEPDAPEQTPESTNFDKSDNLDMEIPDEIWTDFDDMADFDIAPPKPQKPPTKTLSLRKSTQPAKKLRLESNFPQKPLKILNPEKFEKSGNSGKTMSVVVKKTAPINVQLPFVYLVDVLCTPQFLRKFVYTVRGFVTTLTSSLEHKETMWSLKACINDGTASLDVVLDNAFLENLIGIKATELRQLTQKAKLDKSYQKQITNGLRSCQTFLTNFSGFFDIEFPPNSEPRLISSRDLTPDDVRALDLSVDDTLLPLSLLNISSIS